MIPPVLYRPGATKSTSQYEKQEGATVLVITSLVIKTLLIKTLVIIVLKGDSSHNSHKGDTRHKRH